MFVCLVILIPEEMVYIIEELAECLFTGGLQGE
jgi:hypothetical protein